MGAISRVLDLIAIGNMSLAKLVLATELKERNITFSPEEKEELCETLKQGLDAGLDKEALSKFFDKDPSPQQSNSPRPQPTMCKSINDKIQESIKAFGLIRSGEWDRVVNALKDLLRNKNTPTPKPTDNKDEEKEEDEEEVGEDEYQKALAKVQPDKTKRIDPLAVARAVVEGINPRGVTAMAGINAIVQGGEITGKITGQLDYMQRQMKELKVSGALGLTTPDHQKATPAPQGGRPSPEPSVAPQGEGPSPAPSAAASQGEEPSPEPSVESHGEEPSPEPAALQDEAPSIEPSVEPEGEEPSMPSPPDESPDEEPSTAPTPFSTTLTRH